jgi:hypothetical protein
MMWGPWFGITIGGLLVVLLLIAIAFGTSALLIPVLVAAAIMVFVAIGYGAKSATPGRSLDASKQPDPVRDAAPASGEGSPPPGGSTNRV